MSKSLNISRMNKIYQIVQKIKTTSYESHFIKKFLTGTK